MHTRGVGILKWVFENEQGEIVVVHVPTTQFFALQRINPNNMGKWDHMNLRGQLELPAWGIDFMRAYKALSTWKNTNYFTITYFEGNTVRLQVNRPSNNLLLGKSID